MDEYGSFKEPPPVVHMTELEEGDHEDEVGESTPLNSVRCENPAASLDTPSSHVEGEAVVIEEPEDESEPTLEPVGLRVKRNAQKQYNPYDWYNTIFVLSGRTYISRAFYVVSAVGVAVTILSGIAGIGLQDDRECRAWCSRFALGTLPHSYMGFCLFLLVAFRTQLAYRNYFMGQVATFKIHTALRRFVNGMLFKTPRDAMCKEMRARFIAYCIALPYSIMADLREERKYDEGTIQGLLDEADMADLIKSRSMPLHLLDSLAVMIQKYCGEECPAGTVRGMNMALDSIYQPLSECEMVREAKCAFIYVAHLRLLLVTYLVTLPLALVESLGFSTIPAFLVICYALMSLEMLAVECENPFGHGRSDLRLFDFNQQIRESLMESWERWSANELEEKIESEERLERYGRFGRGTYIPNTKIDNCWTTSYW